MGIFAAHIRLSLFKNDIAHTNTEFISYIVTISGIDHLVLNPLADQ